MGPQNNPSATDKLVYDTSKNGTRRANAAFVVLARNHEWHDVVKSMKQVESTFNKAYGYPWVFLNEEPFTDEFKKYAYHFYFLFSLISFHFLMLSIIRWTSEVTGAKTSYGLIPHDHWYQPDWIDEDKAKALRKEMEDNRIIYGGSLSYV
jgi:alpha 1,2-mannosyltransferase